MKKSKENFVQSRPKPQLHQSKMGYEFDFNSDLWELDGSITLNLARMRELNPETKIGFRNALCFYAEEMAANSTDRALTLFNMYCDFTGEREVSVAGLSNWAASLSKETEYYLGSLRAFLTAWHEWGFPGVGNEVIKYFDESVFRGMTKGKAVKKMCPFSGPLTLTEQGALIDWVSGAFNQGHIQLDEYAIFLTLKLTGLRLVQVRSLRACDLVATENTAGYSYTLNYPRVKQKGYSFREAFNSMSIISDLYLVLRNQCISTREFVERHFDQQLPDDVKYQLPIFIQEDRVLNLKSVDELSAKLIKPKDFLHLDASRASAKVRKVSVKNTSRSERTGDFINFSSRRFRYTKGTNLARRGISGVALAEALDHSNTDHIHVYTANTVETAAQIDAIMAPVLAPLAQAFAGKLIMSEREAIIANDPNRRVKNGEANNVGSCGAHSFCGSGYRACYPCIDFQPWVEAPHHEVRDEVLAERAEQLEAGVSSFVIQSTDRLLLAVEQVIIRCEEKKKNDRSLGHE